MSAISDAVAEEEGVEVGVVDVDFTTDLGEGDDALVAILDGISPALFKVKQRKQVGQFLRFTIFNTISKVAEFL